MKFVINCLADKGIIGKNKKLDFSLYYIYTRYIRHVLGTVVQPSYIAICGHPGEILRNKSTPERK